MVVSQNIIAYFKTKPGNETRDSLKMDYNENSHIKLTIEPCLCCVQVTIYCCGHVFLFIILLQFDRQNETRFFDFWNFPPCTGSRQRPIENPLWNPRYSTSGLVNQRKGMTYNPWTTESKQKTPCYFRVYYTCVFMRQQRHEVFMAFFRRCCVTVNAYSTHDRLLCVGVTKLHGCYVTHEVWIIHELRAFGETGLFWVVERRSNWICFAQGTSFIEY